MKRKHKNLTLSQVNNMLMQVSNKIESNMEQLQKEYNFKLDYSFKPITQEEIENFKN